jgi:hypothetical protein
MKMNGGYYRQMKQCGDNTPFVAQRQISCAIPMVLQT